MDGSPHNGGNRPFRFEAAWLTHISFHTFLNNKWIRGRDFLNLLHDLTPNLKEWNQEVFGNIFKRKRELLSRLNGIQNSPRYGYSNFLDSLEKDLQNQLATTLYQEECLWFQKSRSQWIADGDRNTKYYHSQTIVRRRKNKILTLRDNEGGWVDDPDHLKNIVRDYYVNLFKEENPIRDPIISWNTYPTLEEHHDSLSAHVQINECKRALFDMNPHKAPGEDGYPAIFFQKCWDTVADSIYQFVNQVWVTPSLISSINNTLIVMIPKIDKPEFNQAIA
ncbi:putative RNA-directed DNA polymerase [Medicago truncatula]|uniref:Putative RNA-directed DNA polymerase n=1 Tax=Medicago truncatula TaxID=3880 RepID=A0A396JLS2_MEDTR|nr:putative RNA-directed DNA polymerase [Medicago truncatula]